MEHINMIEEIPRSNNPCGTCDWIAQNWMPDMPEQPFHCGNPKSPKYMMEIEKANGCENRSPRFGIYDFAIFGMDRP